MNRDAAIDLLDRLHEAQNEFYAGASGAALEQLLAPNITWTVPGDNRIAGNCRGLEEVLDYFRRRRDLADHTFQMKRRDVLVGDGDRLAALSDGFATIRGEDRSDDPLSPRRNRPGPLSSKPDGGDSSPPRRANTPIFRIS